MATSPIPAAASSPSAKDEPSDELAIAGVPPRGQLGARAGVVALVVAAAVAFGAIKLRSERAHALAKAAETRVAPAPPPPEPPKPIPSAEPAAATSAPAPATAAPSASAEVKGDKRPETDPAEAKADARGLRDEALQLLQNAKNREAMATATQALEADPTDAMPYLVLGSALQEIGHWREATHAYQVCVKTAKKGMVDECRAMLHKR